MKKIKLYSLILLMLFSSSILTSCATIMHGTRQSVGISSNPSYANVWLDQQYIGTTPLIAEMSRKNNHFVHIELQGFQPFDAAFSRQVSGWVFGNVIFGGIIGLAVDAISGGLYKLTPDQIQAELRSHQMSTYSKKSADSYIAVVLKADPAWEKIGNLTKTN